MSGLLASLVFAAPAAAVVPGDEPADAIPISTAEFGAPQAFDTSEATDGAGDPTSCESPDSGLFEGPFTETVWHTFTPAQDGELIVDVNSFPDPEAPGFLAILFVFEDDGAGGLGLVGCSAFPATVRFAAAAGTTYYAMTGSLPETPGGGPAVITVLEPFLSGLTVDPDATYDPQTNLVTVTGTVSCADIAVDFLELFADAVQEIGQHLVFAGGGIVLEECGRDTAWSIEIDGFTGPLNPGTLQVNVNAFACAASVCLGDFTSATARAHPTSNKPVPEPPPPPLPENDERGGATPLGIDEGHLAQDATSATANPSDPADCDGTPLLSDATLWFSFTPDADMTFEVNTLFSDHDTTLFVLDADTTVACNDDFEGEPFSLVYVEGTAGTTYDIMVGAVPGGPVGATAVGVFTPPPPPPPAPDNDERADALELEVDGQSLEADTGGATVNLDTDPQECLFEGFPPSEHTVWYSITPDGDAWIELNTLGSDFDTTLYVLEGDEIIACNDDAVEVSSRVVFAGVAGSTYEIMVGTFDGSPGGNLVISALTTDAPPPPPPTLEAEITFDEAGSLDARTGVVTLGGTITCSLPATGFASAEASQEGGRFLAVGFGGTDVACGEGTSRWSVTIVPETAKFQNGELLVYVEVFVSPEDGIGHFEVFEGVISVRPARAV